MSCLISGTIDYEVIDGASFTIVAIDTSPSSLSPRRSIGRLAVVTVVNVNDNMPIFRQDFYSEFYLPTCSFVVSTDTHNTNSMRN